MKPLRTAGIAATVVVAALTAWTVGASASPTGPGPQRQGDGPAAVRDLNQPLRVLAGHSDLRVGTAVDVSALAADATYRNLVAEQFNTVTAENVMKWDSLEPVQGQYNWAPADGLVDFARQHDQLVRGHTLLWHNQLPGWLTSGTFTPDQLRELLRRHVIDVVTHFRGRVWHWDVINEAFNDDGTLRDTIWLRNLGPGYIADTFRWAHQADPKVKLYYNDYNIEGITPKSTAVYQLVRDLRARGVPIHGVGIQGHLGTQYGFNGDVPENMARFAALGVDVAVTEADVRSVLPMDNPKTQAQAQGYSVLMQACLLTRRCVSFTVWGFSDKYQWVPSVFPGQGAAAIYDENFNPKPALRALKVDLVLGADRRHRS